MFARHYSSLFFLLWAALLTGLLTGCEKKEPLQQPLDSIFYSAPLKDVDPQTLLTSYTSALEASDGPFPSFLPQNFQKTNVFSQLNGNPKISMGELEKLSRDQGPPSSSDVSSSLPLATFIDNHHRPNLTVKLPQFLPTALYIAQQHITLVSSPEHSQIKDAFVVGLDMKKISFFVGLRHEYLENLIPTTVSVKGSLSAASLLLLKSTLHLEDSRALILNQGKKDQGLSITGPVELYHSTLFMDRLEASAQSTLTFYGKSALHCQEKCIIHNTVSLYPEDQCFASESSQSPNDTVVTLDHVRLAPQTIVYTFTPHPNNGHFDVKGEVDLSNTTLQIQIPGDTVDPETLNKRYPLIRSNSPILGTPKVDSLFYHEEMKNHYEVQCVIEGQNAYLLLSKLIHSKDQRTNHSKK